jgi:hypothetical protein
VLSDYSGTLPLPAPAGVPTVIRFGDYGGSVICSPVKRNVEGNPLHMATLSWPPMREALNGSSSALYRPLQNPLSTLSETVCLDVMTNQ